MLLDRFFYKVLLLIFITSSSLLSKSGFIVSHDSNIMVMYKDSELSVYSKILKKTQYELFVDEGSVNFLTLNYNGKYLASYTTQHLIYIWNLETGKLVNKISLKEGVVKSLLFNDQVTSLVVMYKDNTFQSFDIKVEEQDKLDSLISQEFKEKTDSQGISGVNEFITIDVMYGTNRVKTGKKVANDFFGKSFGSLSYGLAHVSIPVTHKAGEIERPDWFKFEFEEDPRKHVMIQNLKMMNKKEFNQYMKRSFSKMNKKDVLIFIHGFSNQFDEALRRTGQIAYDLDFPGIAMTYSWPSQGSFSVSNYEQDEIFSKKSIPYLKKFLLNVIKNSPNQKINIIAHSMGNRVLTNAIAEIQKQSKGNVFNQVILAAPDVNAKVFKEEILPKMQGKAKKITLYASSDDNALMASRLLNNQSRLGESGEYLTIAKGMDTIDSTGIDPSTMGHSYFSSTRTLLEDIKTLILKGNQPKNRKLIAIEKEDQDYCKIILNKNQ